MIKVEGMKALEKGSGRSESNLIVKIWLNNNIASPVVYISDVVRLILSRAINISFYVFESIAIVMSVHSHHRK
jgi:Na+/H+ antiporter NhaD/arsenite permease-like protein